jgi:serine protease Do
MDDQNFTPPGGYWDDPWDRQPSRLHRGHAKKQPPQAAPSTPSSEETPARNPHRKKIFTPRFVLVLSLLVVVMSLCGAGFGIYTALRQSSELVMVEDDGGTVEILPDQEETETEEESSDEADTAACYVEQAPLGDGTALTLVSAAGKEELSYEEIYAANIDSVVSLVCALEDGSHYATGTGIIFSSDGYIVTNEHVIEDASDITVTLNDSSQYTALFVGMDVQTDLAVLKISAKELTAAEFGQSDEIVVGNRVVAIGNPLGVTFRGTMTTGIISAINRNVQVNDSYMNLIQTDCAINSGNSGGPLINRFGQVIGICNMKMMSSTTTVEGIGFAIPSSTVATIATKLIAKGEVIRAMLGITAYDLTAAECQEYGVTQGIMVVTVLSTTDAFAQGIRSGDIITAANGTPISRVDQLNTLKADMSPGDTIVLTVVHNGVSSDLTVTLMAESDVS